jgi:mRNA interferase RelE/StbE
LKVDFKKSFLRDLKRIKETHVKDRLRETIESIENAKHFQEISHLSKIKYGDRYYRIRIGDYRLGLILEGDLSSWSVFSTAKTFTGISLSPTK